MAGKKKKNATVPQKWEDVPEISKEEQPYPLPEGWKWVKFGDVNLYKNKSINPFHEKEKTFELYSVPSSANNYPEIIKGKDIGSVKQEVNLNDVLLCKINPRINRVWKVSGYTSNKFLASSEWIVFRNNKISADYVKWYFTSPIFREFMLSHVSGVGGSLMRAQPKFVATYPIPLPPIETQQRIVNRIESLFYKLDEAAEKVQAVIDSHEARKQAILHKAFSGELTRDIEIKEDASWKDIPEVHKDEQPYPLPEGWKWIRLNNVITLSNETIEEFTGKEIYVGLENLEKGGGLNSYGDSQKIASMKNVFHKDAILYGKLRPYLNKHYVSEIEGICSTDISVFYAKANCLNKFVNYYFNTLFFIEYTVKNSKGINLPRVSPQVILKAPFPYPSLKIQQSVIHYIESLFFKLDEGVEKARELNKLYKIIKKDILFKAFNGMLE